MNDNAIKNYAVWARRELMSEVEKRCAWWGISEGAQADAESIDGRVLSAQERKQRADLLRIVKSDGYGQLVEKAAYTWFNRLLAIRFMEVNDRLPSHVRMLSSASGEFEPQCLREALDLPLDALDKGEAVRLVQSGDDEALFRLVFLAQCAELAECMPVVFEKVGSAMELLLPTGLLRRDGVVGQLVEQIPEDDWREGVEIVGWMYQYYMTEVRADLQDVNVGRGQIGTATQVYTSDWIVRYMVENSIGRLWMLNHPESKLADSMPYYVKSDESLFLRISTPEELSVMDPACGSGHILAYAFDLLAKIYSEAGYSNRDAAKCIIGINLHGLEIDDRATALASFALTMKACELDSRFLKRGLIPNVRTLKRLDVTDDESAMCTNLQKQPKFLESIRHLDVCGSLLQPTDEDLAALQADIAELKENGTLFAHAIVEQLEMTLDTCRRLAGLWAVTIANPPYRNSGKMDKWANGWLKENYPEEKFDLFAAFIWRLANARVEGGVMAIAASNSWMFISSYEKARKKILSMMDIATLVQLSVHGYEGIAAQVFVFACVEKQPSDYLGGYIRLNDFDHHSLQGPKTLEAVSNEECGWFYRRNTSAFEVISGAPIVYWASKNFYECFARQKPLSAYAELHAGARTGENERFIRYWWEISTGSFFTRALDSDSAKASKAKWFPCNKGGGYRRWYGNNFYAIDWENDGEGIRNHPGSDVSPSRKIPWFFTNALTWGSISSGDFSMRSAGTGYVYTDKGPGLIVKTNAITLKYVLALMNCSIVAMLQRMLSPTLDFHEGQLGKTPTIVGDNRYEVEELSETNVAISRNDWDSCELSWDFNRHPLV